MTSRWRKRGVRVHAFAVVACALVLVGGAQNATAQGDSSFDSVRVSKPLFTWRDGALAAGFVGLTGAMFHYDRSIALRLQHSSAQQNGFLKSASKDFEFAGTTGAIVASAGAYAVGRLGGWDNASDLGLHEIEAIGVSGVVTTVLKDVVGRARPYVSADTNPHDFRSGRSLIGGGDDYVSFPSGHATVAFAAAAVATSESQRWWPQGVWVVAPVMYGGATLVGLSRMYNNAHWASDIVAGAAIGTFAGLKVVRFNHGDRETLVDRWLLGMNVLPAPGGGVGVGWSFAP